jgi:hypothetical protein
MITSMPGQEQTEGGFDIVLNMVEPAVIFEGKPGS